MNLTHAKDAAWWTLGKAFLAIAPTVLLTVITIYLSQISGLAAANYRQDSDIRVIQVTQKSQTDTLKAIQLTMTVLTDKVTHNSDGLENIRETQNRILSRNRPK